VYRRLYILIYTCTEYFLGDVSLYLCVYTCVCTWSRVRVPLLASDSPEICTESTGYSWSNSEPTERFVLVLDVQVVLPNHRRAVAHVLRERIDVARDS
jgi:hypothetical protein